MNQSVSIREVQQEDIPFIVGYWNNTTSEQLLDMGVELSHRSTLDDLEDRLKAN